MQTVPFYLIAVAILTTMVTVLLAARAMDRRRTFILIMAGWLLVQGALALSGFYQNTAILPPRFFLTIGPPLLAIAALASTSRGRRFMDGMDIRALTLLHIVRIPVELMLWGLYLHGTVPKLMTFEGGNLDILSGISALIMYFAGFRGGRPRRKALIVWNIACIGLLVNIVMRAVLAAPFPFQQLGFEQPNVAILWFPFVWLPACIVPLVLLAHMSAIRQLVQGNQPIEPGKR